MTTSTIVTLLLAMPNTLVDLAHLYSVMVVSKRAKLMLQQWEHNLERMPLNLLPTYTVSVFKPMKYIYLRSYNLVITS
jgi:hypothetical protein